MFLYFCFRLSLSVNLRWLRWFSHFLNRNHKILHSIYSDEISLPVKETRSLRTKSSINIILCVRVQE